MVVFVVIVRRKNVNMAKEDTKIGHAPPLLAVVKI